MISLTFTWYKLKLNYAYWNFETQLLVIIFGTLGNTMIFSFWILVCHISQRYIYCFPPAACKMIAWYGLATILDFVLILTIDMAN